MKVKKKPQKHAGKEGTELGEKGADMQGCRNWQPQEMINATRLHAVARKKRKPGYVGNGVSPSDVQSREDSGAGQKTAVYGRRCVPLGKRGNLQRIPLRKPPPVMKNLAFLLLVKIC